MTNAEAIRIINQYDCNFYWTDGEKIPTEDLIEAFELAVKALDAQTPRVLMAFEVKPCLPYWLEFPESVLRPVICYDAEWDAKEPYITLVWQYGTASYKTECYGVEWRCWSSRPTDEQREGTPWGKD